MKAKQYLRSLRLLDISINQKIKEMEGLERSRVSLGSMDYSRDRVQTSPEPDASYTHVVDHIADLQAEINREIDRYVDRKHKIINQIQGLEDHRYVDVLYKRYVEGKRMEEIAYLMSYNFKYTLQLHAEALTKFEEIYGTNMEQFCDIMAL